MLKSVFCFGAWVYMALALPLWAEQPESQDLRVYRETELERLFEDVASRVIDTVRRNPEAVILLPTGTTPEKLYAEIIKRFKNDATINFSKVHFISLDEYIGLEEGHPLSFQYYMEVHFYDPLRKIDAGRAPHASNIHIPPATNSTGDILFFHDTIERLIEESPTQSISLAILGIGGAYPEETEEGDMVFKGGHIAFNEPGTSPEAGIRSVMLTEKTRQDTSHRFASLKRLICEGIVQEPDSVSYTCEVPHQAVTLGIRDLKRSDEIIVIALSEDKAPVIEHIFSDKSADLFPAKHLISLPQVSWYLDSSAASRISVRPWRSLKENEVCPREWVWEAMCDFASKDKLTTITFSDLSHVGLRQGLTEEQFIKHRDQFRSALTKGIDVNSLPEGKRILVISPHPDDDVISMGATLTRLRQRANDVYILYGVSGANAVSTSVPEYSRTLKELQDYFEDKKDMVEIICQAKACIRENEALRATGRLGIPSKNLIFFKGDYYNRRGVPGLSPFSHNDWLRMTSLIEEIQPDHIYFAAENDPNGAHGLTTQLVAQALEFLKKEKRIKNITLYGYRGAYNEWPLYEARKLILVSFDQKTLDRKILSIRDHVSQLDPLYPSFDPRPFFQRTKDRNQESLKKLTAIMGEGVLDPISREKAVGIEAFYEISSDAFIRRYNPDS
tara:strand:- start:1805 stop:3823 length:2019 start_codon:yes stop_codon:yes gene_type:complete